jgi:hypothetical protein
MKIRYGTVAHPSIYPSEDVLLQNLLSKTNSKHYKQLRYLASKHERTCLKLWFVLNPISFVFLPSGSEQFYRVLETYDTEEATYIWRLKKDFEVLTQKFKYIDQDLNMIRNKGGQFFLESTPFNFSKIIYDYTDDRKGFILWTSLLEECLT